MILETNRIKYSRSIKDKVIQQIKMLYLISGRRIEETNELTVIHYDKLMEEIEYIYNREQFLEECIEDLAKQVVELATEIRDQSFALEKVAMDFKHT